MEQPATPISPRARLIIFVAIGLAVLIGIGVFIATLSSGSPTSVATPSPATSGTPEPTPTPQDTAKAPAINFVGLEGFDENGLSDDQMTALKFGFSKYAKANKPVKTATLSAVEPAPRDPSDNNPTFTLTFTANLDGTIYNGRFDYADLTAGRLFLINKSGKQIFDSGLIDVYNGVGVN